MEETFDCVWEVCPHCTEEVKLSAKFEIQMCPSCGKLIKPCALCDHDTCDCVNCPLGKDIIYND